MTLKELYVRLAGFEKIDWDNNLEIHNIVGPLLTRIANNKELLNTLIEKVKPKSTLFKNSEHYEFLDKIILYHSDSIRLRLHIFLPDYIDTPHTHRWNFCSYIISGSYKHHIYSTDSKNYDNLNPQELLPKIIRTEKEKSYYTISTSVLHSVIAEPYTVSLILRGPATESRYMVIDKMTNKFWWKYGKGDESREEIIKKQMTEERLSFLKEKLRLLNVI